MLGPDWVGYVQWSDGFQDICRRRSADAALAYARRKLESWPDPPHGACVAVRRADVAPPDVKRRGAVLVPAIYGIGGNKESAKLAHAGFTVGALGRGVVSTMI